MNPRIAFCTTCKGRAQHIKLTLLQNMIDTANYENAVFVLLNYGSTDDLMDYVTDELGWYVATGRLVVYTYENAGPFHMTHAKNMAHRLGLLENATILVNLDADNFLGPGFAQRIADTFAANDPDTFMAIGKINPGVTPRGVSGRIVVPSHAFINAGGYDEQFNTWSPDDKDFNFRLRRMGYKVVTMESTELDCVRHNDRMRFRDYPHAKSTADSQAAELVEHTHTIVNHGKVGCGVVRKNFGTTHIALDLIPTRVFGIGMHKTGTTSLHHALEHLGLQSAHWISAHWAKRIWREMNTTGQSPTLERHYALCDMPISNLFQKLDKGYPGSKFILTLRDEKEWLESVHKHWDIKFNRFRNQWDTDPFTHIIHKVTYGRTDFDATIFLDRYRRHNENVMEYFKQRPNDLLVMPKHDWGRLCRFLGKAIPAVQYPKMNQYK